MKSRPSDPYPTILSTIIENATGEEIYSESTIKGTVGWESDYVVKYASLSGIPNPDSNNSTDEVHRYHVKNKKKFSGKFMKKGFKKS